MTATHAARIAFPILLLGGLFWLLSENHKSPAPASSTSIPETRPSPTRVQSFRNSARTLAELRIRDAKNFSKRIADLRSEIDQASDPSSVFKELADLISSISDPIARSNTISEIFNPLFDFNSAKDGFEWLRKHEKSLSDSFSQIASGGDGTISPNSNFTTLRSACYIFSSKAINKQQESDLIRLFLETPTPEIIESSTLLSIFSTIIDNSLNLNKLQDAPANLREITLGHILNNHNPQQPTSGIKRYLSQDFSSYSDPNRSTIEHLASPSWYTEHYADIEPLLSSSSPSLNKDRFLATLARRATETNDGNARLYLDQIQDLKIKTEASRTTESVSQSLEK